MQLDQTEGPHSCAGGNLPELPDIVVNWHHDVHLQLRLLDVSDAHDTILLDMASAQVITS